MPQNADQLITTIRNNVPRVLQEQAAWRTWRKFVTPDGRTLKIPLCLTEQGWRSVRGQSGHDLSTAAPMSVAEKGLRAGQGEGLGISINPDLGWVGLDLDWKGWTGRSLDQVIVDAEAAGRNVSQLRRVASFGTGAMPWPAAITMSQMILNGAYVEMSPSGLGAHALIPGSAPEGHSTRGSLTNGYIGSLIGVALLTDSAATLATPDELKQWRAGAVGVELYSTNRWFTVTGLSIVPSSLSLTMERSGAHDDAITDLATEVCGKKAREGGEKLGAGSMPRLSDVKILTAAQLPGQFGQRIRSSEQLTHLWDNPECSDRSKRDHRIARTIQETEGMTPELGWQLFNACPAVQRAKFDAMHGTQTYGQMTWAKAAAQGGFGPGEKPEGETTGTEAAAAWTPAQISRLRSGLIGALMEPGKPMNRNRVTALGDLLVWIAERATTRGAEQKGGLLWVSLGTVTAMTCEVPGQFAAVQERLNDLWRSGLLLGLEREDGGRMIAALPVDPAEHPCVKKVQSRTRKGLILDLTPSVREQGKKAAKKTAQAQSDLPEHLAGHLTERDLAVMDTLLTGRRSAAALAKRLALPVESVSASLARLELAGHISGGKATMTQAQWLPVKREARRERRLASLNYRRARLAIWRSNRATWAGGTGRAPVCSISDLAEQTPPDSVYDAVCARQTFASKVRGGRV